MAYDNVRILGQYGDIVNDSGYIHMDIMADFILFQPQKGQKLLVRLTDLSVVLSVKPQLSYLYCLLAEATNKIKYVWQIKKKMAFYQLNKELLGIFENVAFVKIRIEYYLNEFSSQGKVNKLGMSHVGCLVHGCFNASIPKPNLVPMETWRDAGPRIGADLEFEVTALDADSVGVLLIRGRLDRTR